MHHPTLRPSTRGSGLSIVCLAALLLTLAFIEAAPARAAECSDAIPVKVQ